MPNNGVKIYSQTVNGVTHGIDYKDDVYKVLQLSPVGGRYSINYACQNTHGKINRYSKFKPYAAGDVTKFTDIDCRRFNYGMVPVLLLHQQDAAHRLETSPWGQWQPPTATHRCRVGDFDGYNNAAVKWLMSAKVYTSKSINSTKPVIGSTGGDSSLSAKLIGEIEVSGSADAELTPADFYHNDAGVPPYAKWRLTLLFAPWEGFEWGGTPWVVQGPRVEDITGGNYKLELTTTDNMQMLNALDNQTDGRSISILCLSPDIRVDSDGRAVDESSILMLSLNMWGDPLNLVNAHDAYERPALPTPSGTGTIYGTVTSPKITYAEFTYENSTNEFSFGFEGGIAINVDPLDHEMMSFLDENDASLIRGKRVDLRATVFFCPAGTNGPWSATYYYNDMLVQQSAFGSRFDATFADEGSGGTSWSRADMNVPAGTYDVYVLLYFYCDFPVGSTRYQMSTYNFEDVNQHLLDYVWEVAERTGDWRITNEDIMIYNTSIKVASGLQLAYDN